MRLLHPRRRDVYLRKPALRLRSDGRTVLSPLSAKGYGMDIGVNVGMMAGVGVGIIGIHPL